MKIKKYSEVRAYSKLRSLTLIAFWAPGIPSMGLPESITMVSYKNQIGNMNFDVNFEKFGSRNLEVLF